MKHLLAILAMAVAVPAFSQSMKVVVDTAGTVIGRYMHTNADTYTVGVQDIFDVPKVGHKVIKYRAKDGQGVIWCRHPGRVNVYAVPSTKSAVIGQMVYEDGYVPETYPCAGKHRNWFKVKIDGTLGYVPANSVLWDAIDTF
ncbi:MAG: hypothetical protein J6B13_04805 [Muribaculaceae bacterium]|nr:hypothetical protein [Muribaculaceae bacterium]